MSSAHETTVTCPKSSETEKLHLTFNFSIHRNDKR